MKFTDLDLSRDIMKAITDMGYEEMTPIQEVTYPIIAAGDDLCALAETGSGKTAACAIPLIQKIDPEENAIQCLVIVPTRELCIQYVNEIHKIGVSSGVVPFGIYGGFSKEIQVAKLIHEVHVLVATPGRLIDLMYDGTVSLSRIKCVVLDEADELLQTGFFDDIDFILSCIIHDHQTLLFAATMADDIKILVDKRFRNPRHISLIRERPSPESIEHYFQYVHPRNKLPELMRLLVDDDIEQVIIFCNARHKVDDLYRRIKKEVSDVEYIHAGLSQDKRSSIYGRYRKNKIRYLIATDVAGRGLDFSSVSHVVNWDFPGDGEQYTHRTGRSGRMGRKGTAITFVTRRDIPQLRKLLHKLTIRPLWRGKDILREEAPQKDEQTQKGEKGSRPPRRRRRKRKPQEEIK
jgi:ATP-dependent RNA helicase DeaD